MQKTHTPHKGLVLTMRILFTIFLMGTVVFIFANSSQIGELSGLRSQSVTAWLNGLVKQLGFGFTLSELTVRKLGHLAEYMLLGFWLMLTLRVYTKRIISFIAWPLFFTLLIAVADEFYQTFVPGRSGQVVDVIIDFIGSCIGLGVGLFIMLLAQGIWQAIHGKE